MKRIIFFLMVVPAFILGSCIKDMDGPLPRGGKKLSLSVVVKQSGIQTVTRATVPSEQGEDDITALYLLFFQPNGGQYIDYVEVDNPAQGTSTDLDISNHPLLGVDEAYDILAVANIGDDRYITGKVDNWMQQWSSHTMNEVKAQAIAYVNGGEDDSNAIAPNQLLMTGSISKAKGQFELDLELTRNVIRFDIYNDQNEDYDLVSAEIWNAYPSCAVWESGTTINYSSSIARLGHFYGVNNSTNMTDTDGADGKGKTLDDIMGGLYCFENQVINPSQNDRFTTCLIVGLKERASGTTSYYRVNINPKGSAQLLTANNVYRLTIRGVDSGSTSAEKAYGAAESGLDYMINYWDMSDYGVIIQDGNSILSIPTKTVTIEKGGGQLSYQVFTFNNTGSTSVLAIKGQNYTAAGINATLNGNTLIIQATPLGAGETERTGTIILTYAGLEATVNVVQNSGAGDYLRVLLPSEKIRPLAPYAGMATGNIHVEASGSWTAELFMPDNGFTFDPAQISPNPAVTKILSSGTLVTDDEFKVYTWSANTAPTKRDCFVVITLDSDPENYAAVVQLAQSPAGGISIVPNVTSVTFNSMGDGLAAVAGNTTNTFNVRPSMETDNNGNEQIAAWGYEIKSSGGNDDTNMFRVVGDGPGTHSQTDAAANTITVEAVGPNYSGRPYTAVLRLYLSLDPTTYTQLTLIQQPLSISLSPGTLPAVETDGGQTGAITVVGDASLKWTASIATDLVAASPDGKRHLVHHAATLVDKNGNPIGVNDQHSMDEPMYVRFPKVYYPNRDIPISATITVTAAGMTSTLTVNQTTLTARKMVGYGMAGAPDYGELGDTYNRGWDGTSGTYGLAQIPGYTRLGIGNINATSIPASVDYLHVVPHIAGANGTNYSWSVINNFIDTRDAWTVIAAQDNNGLGPMNNPYSPTKRNGAGYQNMKYSVSASWSQVFQDRATPSKLYQFVMDKGHTPLTPDMINSAGFYNDGVCATIPSPWPSTAVVLMTKINNTNEASLIVDIKNKFMWIGESQIFWYDAYLTNGRGTFLDNLMYFIGNASKYGSSFTDLLLEDNQPGAQPAPWDTSYWGANAGVESK